ncbi:SPOR domain-containing protein, partial [Flavobacteriales bacterium]|nr:SPOR domain-containing protein [Flavobacteriales bacterium]
GQKYHLIAGCFSTIDNANRMVSDLSRKGYPSEIVAKNEKGLYMVSYLTFTSEQAALESLQDLKDEGRSTWISIR